MLVHYNICGNLTVKGKPVTATYTVKNLDTNFISKAYISAKGFYNINLANFPNKQFKEGDVISIEFKYIDNDGVNYYTRIAVAISSRLHINVIDVILVSNWDHTSQIDITSLYPGKIKVNFIANMYTTILFKLYYKYNNKYQEVESGTITKSSITMLNFPYSGKFMLVGYVFYESSLLSYSQKEFDITSADTANSRHYIEWE